MKLVIITAILSIGTIVSLAVFRSYRPKITGHAAAEKRIQPDSGDVARRPVVLELFTSEGCDSCPPADKLLTSIEKSQPIAGAQVIALEEHVDYWNSLGWQDPFSSRQFSDRQQTYSSVIQGSEIYTPQMVVDGRTQFAGNDNDEAEDAIGKSASLHKAGVTLSLTPGESGKTDDAPMQLSLEVQGVPAIRGNQAIEAVLAITEDGLSSNVSRGENSGMRLDHTAVVRRLSTIGTIDNTSGDTFKATVPLSVEANWKRENLHAVVFLQEKQSLRILGAGSIGLVVAVKK